MAMYVVKVQFGDSLRRLSLGEDVAFSFAHLVGRTRDLFQISANAQLVLTYVDRDGDVVTMAEDQDLQDALMLQALNPLRVSASIVGAEAATATAAAATTADMMVEEERLQQRAPQARGGHDRQADVTAGEAEPVHHGVICDDCGVRNIRGPRYKSLKRVDYDLCGRCFAKPGVDPNDFMTIRRGRPDRRSVHFSRGGGGHGCDSRNPNFRHHRHGSHHHIHPLHRRGGRHGCPMGMGSPGSGKFTGDLGHDAPLSAGGEAIHFGVTCDECNVNPIVGLRFKSIKKYDYDLCQACMQRAGPGAADEYTRIDQPLQHLHPHMFMGRYCRGFPPYAFFPVTPYGRPRCPRRIQPVSLMTPEGGEREGEASKRAEEVQMGIPAALLPEGVRMGFAANSTGGVQIGVPAANPTEGSLFGNSAPGAAAQTRNAEEQMVEAGSGSGARGVSTQEQNGAEVVAVAETEEVVMVEADGKVDVSENSFQSAMNEPQKASVVAEKTEEDVSTYEGMVAKLASMGFTDNKLNEELLKKNNFDLRMTLDDLCAVEDWDPILEELQEMGFYDADLNRRLLFSNKGSVKRTVKELVQMAKGEESSSFSK